MYTILWDFAFWNVIYLPVMYLIFHYDSTHDIRQLQAVVLPCAEYIQHMMYFVCSDRYSGDNGSHILAKPPVATHSTADQCHHTVIREQMCRVCVYPNKGQFNVQEYKMLQGFQYVDFISLIYVKSNLEFMYNNKHDFSEQCCNILPSKRQRVRYKDAIFFLRYM